MGRARAFAVLILAAALLAAAPLTPLRWLASGRDPAAALGRRPAECLPPAARSWPVEAGRAAFRAPLLLGGQAARAGLSCSACHRSGRGNPDFHFAGISGAPGTADVTASLFSTHRGDGIANPKPIPDLATGPRRVARDGPALERFIAGLITQEFDGPPPPPAVLTGLVAYVRALDAAACPAGDVAVTIADDLDAAARAAAAAAGAFDRRDPASAAFLIAATRSELGRIDERFAGNAARQRELARAAADLTAIRNSLDPRDLAAWRAAWPARAARLTRDAPASLYAPARLASLRSSSALPPANGISPMASGTKATPGRNSRSEPDS